jgi:hypothetical protein
MGYLSLNPNFEIQNHSLSVTYEVTVVNKNGVECGVSDIPYLILTPPKTGGVISHRWFTVAFGLSAGRQAP